MGHNNQSRKPKSGGPAIYNNSNILMLLLKNLQSQGKDID